MDASLESKAMTLLETYNGGNNYIIELKRKSQINKRFYPTRSQSEYIINNHDKQPKVAKKWVILDAYFAQKLADDKLMTEIPEKVWVEKLLADKEKAFHIWGKVTESEQLHDFWLPKAAIIKDNTVKDVVINYDKYSHRPPLEHQKESIQKLVENKKFILADDMGLGKTTSTIIAALESGSKKVLIICPATLKINWKREIENYSDKTVYIAEGKNFSTDADFVITGEVYPGENKPEGPFGDHLGYYSLEHSFPLMRVHKVYARKNAIWAFTVVGRPPQEDTSFGQLIHAMTGAAVSNEIPGLKEVHAVDAAGVHPLLLAIGSERYTPYLTTKQPAEILTIANHILGTGQLSLAKFVFITADDTNQLSTHHVQEYFEYILSRLDLGNDIHFYTKTTMDTLDYSGEGLNAGSKVVIAAYGDVKRNLATTVPTRLLNLNMDASLVMPGVIAVNASTYSTSALQNALIGQGEALLEQEGVVFIIRTEDPKWMASDLNNFLWAGFTRTNPSHDIEAIDAFTVNKHWGAKGPLVFDATIKPHHAPPVLKDAAVEKRVDAILEKYGY